MSTLQFLAQNNFGDNETGGMAGPMGLFILVLLALATVFLIRNMNKRLRRLPDKFPDEHEAEASEKREPTETRD